MSKTKAALVLLSAVIAIAFVERVLRVLLLLAFWPSIALWSTVDRELAAVTEVEPLAARTAIGLLLLVLLFVDSLLVAIAYYLLRSGRGEFSGAHARKVAWAGTAMVLYAVSAFVGNIGVAVGVGTFLPWFGYTLSFDAARFTAFSGVNVMLAILAGLGLFWAVDGILGSSDRKLAILALVIGVASAVAVLLAGLAVISAFPYPTGLHDAQPAFAIPEVAGDSVAMASLSVWFVAYTRTLRRFRRGELVAKPPPPVYSTPPPYIPPAVMPPRPPPVRRAAIRRPKADAPGRPCHGRWQSASRQ